MFQVMPDLVGAVDRKVLFPYTQDLRLEFRIPDRSRGRRPLLRRVIRRWGDAKHLGDRLDSPTQLTAAPILVFVDEPEHFFDWRSSSAPKKRTAAFRISFARRNSAFSRFKRFSSASSSVVAPGRRPLTRSA